MADWKAEQEGRFRSELLGAALTLGPITFEDGALAAQVLSMLLLKDIKELLTDVLAELKADRDDRKAEATARFLESG